MTPEDDSNARVGAKIGMPASQVALLLASMNETPQLTAIVEKFSDRITIFIAERTNKLRKRSAHEDICYTQGVADGLDLALTQIREKL